MKKPANLSTRILLDSGNPQETEQALHVLGFLDGQTTNPSLIAKHPNIKGKTVTRGELYKFYRDVVTDISRLVPDGSVSVEVYANQHTTARKMFSQGKEMFSWIPNAHIKYPATSAGLTAAHWSIAEGMRINMTLVFSLKQAQAVYAATQGAKKGDVFISPFIGRLDDEGINGLDLVKHIMHLYKDGDGHVEVLTASVRSVNHIYGALALESDSITAPFTHLKAWHDAGMQIPDSFQYDTEGKIAFPYTDINRENDWQNFSLTSLEDIPKRKLQEGIEKFATSWDDLIANQSS